MTKFTDEEMAMLTDDERRVIEELGEEYDDDNVDPPMDPDDDEFEDADDDGDGEEDPDEDGGDADDGDAEDPEEDAEAAEGEKEPKGEPEAEEEQEPAPVAAQQPAPALTAEMPEGYEDKIKEYEDRREKLDVDFDDGELTSLEYRQQLREIETEEKALRDQVLKAQIAQEMQVERQKQDWLATVNSFLDEKAVYRQSEMLYEGLNMQVIAIAKSDDAAGMTGRQILEKAHANLKADPVLGRVFDGEAGDKPKGEKNARTARKVPPTLGKVPAAESTSPEDGSRYARLDKMDGLALENELAKLAVTNPRAYEEYMAR